MSAAEMRVLILSPSRGLGGGIERYVDSVEAAARLLPSTVDRLDLYGPDGPDVFRKLVFPARAIGSPSPTLIWAMHPNLFGVARWVSRIRRVPWVGWVYGAEVFRPPDARAVVENSNAADLVVAISEFTGDALRRGGLSERRLMVIPPVLAPEWWTLVERYPHIESEQPRVVVVTRVDREAPGKGIDALLELAERLRDSGPRFEIVFIGGGSNLDHYRQLVRSRALDERCSFLGAVDDERLALELSRGWIFALPSRLEPENYFGEGFGIVYLEAASLALPVIGSSDGGAREAVRDGETGVVLDPRDLNALERVVRQLTADSALRKRLGEAGAQWTRTEFVIERMRDRLADVVQLLLGEAA